MEPCTPATREHAPIPLDETGEVAERLRRQRLDGEVGHAGNLTPIAVVRHPVARAHCRGASRVTRRPARRWSDTMCGILAAALAVTTLVTFAADGATLSLGNVHAPQWPSSDLAFHGAHISAVPSTSWRQLRVFSAVPASSPTCAELVWRVGHRSVCGRDAAGRLGPRL